MQPGRQSTDVVRFGVFEADVSSGELRKNGVKVKIQDLPFRALQLLLSRPNEVLSRDQFRQALWPEGVFVDFDHGISSAMNRLRDALGDSADNPIFIETVERRGYRWIAPTHFTGALSVSPGPQLVEPEVEHPVAKRSFSPPYGWRWSLTVPATALVLLIIWSFWSNHRVARADAAKPPSIVSPASDSARAEAEQFYLKGRFYWEKRTPAGLNKAVDQFTQAIVRDPTYAPAYVGLANSYNLLREYTLMPASEAYPRALSAAKKAVELDEQSSEAHASLAFALFYGTWDVTGAEREFRRAIDLNPNNAVARHWYATYLATRGRYSDAVAEIERAQALDPASKSILADKADLLLVAGRRDEGISLLKQLESSEPDFISPHRYLKIAYFSSGDYANFIGEWRKEVLLMHDTPGRKLVDTAEKGLRTGGSQRMLQNMRMMQTRLYARGTLSPYSLAETSAWLGNKPEALQYLKAAYEIHDESIVQIEGDPAFNSFHQEPAYKDLVAKLGLSTH